MHRILKHKCCSPDPKMNSETEILNFCKFAPFFMLRMVVSSNEEDLSAYLS